MHVHWFCYRESQYLHIMVIIIIKWVEIISTWIIVGRIKRWTIIGARKTLASLSNMVWTIIGKKI